MDQTQKDWANSYVDAKASAVRGGRKMYTRAEVKADVIAKFPLAGWWTVFQIVMWILGQIRKRSQSR
jgi:hypothetical protein